MAVAQKLACVVERIVDHGDDVYTLDLRPERPAPRFRPGQFLHLAVDPYDPSGFWPESRVFSIASPPAQRDCLTITYAVHGRFTQRMARELKEGGPAWIKLPYGDFVIDAGGDVVLFAGGTGVSAFTAYLESPEAGAGGRRTTLAYGARHKSLLIYRGVVERASANVPTLDVTYFIEDGQLPSTRAGESARWQPGRVSVEAIWPRLPQPGASDFYISGPPAMLKSIAADLKTRGVAAEAIHIDAWE
jgi:ferredoxin-NADP reductase